MKHQKGFLMIAAVIIIMALGLASSALVYMYMRTTESVPYLTSIPQTGLLAEESLEKGKSKLTQPIIAERESCAGLKNIVSNVSTTLSTAIPNDSTPATITVANNAQFTAAGCMLIDNEVFQYTSQPNATTFAGVTRFPGGVPASHESNTNVYPSPCSTRPSPNQVSSTLSVAIASNTTPNSITVSETSAFARDGGRVLIGREVFQYGRISDATTLTNIKRAQDESIAAAHVVGEQVSQYQCTVSGIGAQPVIGTQPVGNILVSREYLQGVQQPLLYAVGASGTITRWNSDTAELAWQTMTSGTTSNINGISVLNYHSGWAVANSPAGVTFNYERLQGGTWTNVSVPDSARGVNLYAVDAPSESEAWAVGDPASSNMIINRWVRNLNNDSTNWCVMPCSGKTFTAASNIQNSALYAIKTYDTNGDGFADMGFAAGVTAGSSHSGGKGNGQGALNCSPEGLNHGGCGGDFSSTGTGSTGPGVILYYSGTGWSSITKAPLNYTQPSIIGQIQGLDITPYGNNPPIEAFFVGHTNTTKSIITRLRMSGGESWNTANNNFSQILRAVSVIDTNGDGLADFGCAVGDQGMVVTFNSSMATTVTTLPTTNSLNAVTVLNPNDIWVAGDGGVRYHFDGTNWVSITGDGLTANLHGIAKVAAKKSPFSLWFKKNNE